MNLDKDVFQRWSPVISFCYVPFHDELFLGDLLPNGIVDGFYAGVAGAAVSFVANKVYNWVQEKKQFSKLLTFKENQSWINTGIQLSARLIVHVATGAVMGLALGLLVTSAEATAATGCAVGFAAFVGPQLLRLMYQVTAFVFSKIWTSFVAGIEWLLDSPVVQEMALESSISSDKENAKTEAFLYKAMGLESAASSVGLKKIWQYDTSGYKRTVKSSISIDILSHQHKQGNIIYNKSMSDDDSCGRLFDAVNIMGEEIRDHRKEHKYDNPNLVTRLAWQVSYAIMNNEPSYVVKFNFYEGMSDPFNFKNSVKISKSDAQLINTIYNRVRRFVKDKPLPNPKIPEESKNQLFVLQKNSLIANLNCVAGIYAALVKTKEESEDKRRIRVCDFIVEHINQAFSNDNIQFLQDYDVNQKIEVLFDGNKIEIEQVEILFINEKLKFARELFNKKENLYQKCKSISEWIYQKYSMSLYPINMQMMMSLHNLVWEVAACREGNTQFINQLNSISYPFQFDEKNVSCPNYKPSKEEVNFINEVFQHAINELTK